MVFWNNLFYSSPVGVVPGCSGTGDVSTEVEIEVPTSKRRAVVTRRLIPLAGDGERPSRPDVLVLERSRHLLEQAFDKSMVVFQMCSLLLLFPSFPHLHDCLF